MSSSRVWGLDLARALAIALVVLSHSERFFTGLEPTRSSLFHYFGFEGVELFFALSGVLIGRILLTAPITDGSSLVRFWSRRWFRTLPAFVVAAALLAIRDRPSIGDFAMRFFFVQNLTFEGSAAPNEFFPVSWSLAIEESFYLGAPLLVLLSGARPSTRKLVAGYVGAIALRASLLAQHPYSYDAAHAWIPARWDALLVGVCAAGVLRSDVGDRVRRIAGLAGVVGAIAILAFWLGVPFRHYSSEAFGVWGVPLNSIMCVLIVVGLTTIREPPTFMPRAINAVVSWVALVSYSLYLYHLEAIRLVAHALPGTGVLRLACAWLLALAGAYLSYRAVEVPFLRIRDRRTEEEARSSR